jgi:AraC-like DNA-binding protein
VGTSRHSAWLLDRALPLNPSGVELVEGTDFDEFARTLALACPNLADLSPASRRAQFKFRLKILRLGAVTLASGTSSAYRASLGESNATTLYVPLRGTYRFRIGNRRYLAQGNVSGMLLSGRPIVGGPEATAGMALNLDEARLTQVGLAMTGGSSVDFQLDRDREIPLLSPALTHRASTLPELLRQLDAAIQTPELIPLLGLDDLLYRHLALLLAPQALSAREPLKPQHKVSRDLVRRLCEMIMAQLPESPSLSALEEASGLSTRAVQYAFQRYLGCTPIEWIRGQRLERVHARLRQPAEDDTVARIALAEGFPHLGDFAGRFKARFGESPSIVLRRARERRA